MIRNVYFNNIWHCLVVETSHEDVLTEKIVVNGNEYARKDFDSIVTINNQGRNEYKLFLADDYHKKYTVTHYENYGKGVASVTIDMDSKKYHGRSDKSLLRTLEDDDIITFSWGMGKDIEQEKAVVIGINENDTKIGFAALVEYGIDIDGRYKYARYMAHNIGVEGYIDSLEGYTNDESKCNTDYNINVKRAAWYGVCNDVTQDRIIASHILAAKKGIRGRIARQDDKR